MKDVDLKTIFIGKEKPHEFAELGSEFEIYVGCLRHPVVSVRGEKFAQFLDGLSENMDVVGRDLIGDHLMRIGWG